MQAGYVAALLYIPALSLAKIAVLAHIRTAIPAQRERRPIYAIGVSVCLWAFIGELVTAFSCDVPQPWNYIGGKCIHRVWDTPNRLISRKLKIVDSMRGGSPSRPRISLSRPR